MIEVIDQKIKRLLEIRDSKYVAEYPELKGWICDTIGHAYFLECCIISKISLKSNSLNFFSADVAVNRYYRDWNLDEVADIYNDLRGIALKYIRE